MKMQADGEMNVRLMFAASALGMLDLIEKGEITVSDASMTFFLPIMMRSEEKSMIHLTCSMAEELETYPPARRREAAEKIRALCFELTADYSREDTLKKEEKISFDFFHGGAEE